MRIDFACGHHATIGDNPSLAPICWCGESRIQSVQARAPRFVGSATGPYCETKALEPAVVSLATGGSLRLQEPQE